MPEAEVALVGMMQQEETNLAAAAVLGEKLHAGSKSEAAKLFEKMQTINAMIHVQQALADTPEVKALKHMKPIGPFAEDVPEAQKDTEIFARAYTQYIAQKSQDPTLLANLKAERGRFIKRYWSDENFRPVAKAFDALFDSKGWLVGSKTE